MLARGQAYLLLLASFDPQMPLYSHSNVTITGGSSTYVAGNLNTNQVEVHGLRGRSEVAFEKLCHHIVPNALHNSGEVADQPKCHPGTRLAILDHLIAWAAALGICTHPIVWLHGPAGGGKSSILRTIAQQLFERRLLLASFFFFRKNERRNTSEYVIATIAYQLALSIPETRQHIEEAIERNPIIFSLSLWDQALALIISPIVSVSNDSSFHVRHYPRIIIIDGLDECRDSSKQCEILQVFHRIIQSVPIPLAILVASRPEHHIRAEFNLGDLKKRSSRLALDESYDPDSDIKKYLVDKFDFIRQQHPMNSHIHSLWPAQDDIDKLVTKASGQFIYAATVDKFVSSPRHNPVKRLDIILGTLHAEGSRPFEQLDNLYSTIFGTVTEEALASTLRILGVLLVPHFDNDPNIRDKAASKDIMRLMRVDETRSPNFVERLLELDSGDVRRLLFDLGSLLAIGKRYENVQFYHASLSDYLFDKSRSSKFWVDAKLIYADLVEHCVRHLPHWPGIRSFFMWNSLLFFSRAAPTARLQQAIQECDFDELILVSSDFDPHGLRDLCPTLVQMAIGESRFFDAKKLFNVQHKDFKRIVAARIHEIYFHSISLRSMVVALTFISATQVNDLVDTQYFHLSPEEIEIECTQGFHLFNTRKPPPVLPFIRTLLNDVDSGCFVNGDQYADAAMYIFESFVVPGSSCIPHSLFTIMEELVPPLLLKSSVHMDLIRCVEKLIVLWRSDHLTKVEGDNNQIWEAMETYASRRQSPKEQQASTWRDIRAPETREIADVTTSPPEIQQMNINRKRLWKGDGILDLSKETSPRLESSSSCMFKRARTTEPRVIGATAPSLSRPSSTTKYDGRNNKTFHAPNCSCTEGRYIQSQTGEDTDHAIIISDSE